MNCSMSKRYGQLRLIVVLLFVVVMIAPQARSDAWDIARFKVNHNPHSVDVIRHFDRAIPQGQVKELIGEGRPGEDVRSIAWTKMISDPNDLINANPVAGKTKVAMTTKAAAVANTYPLTIGGKYVPVLRGKAAAVARPFPDWEGTSEVTVVDGDLIIGNVVRGLDLPDSVAPGSSYDVDVIVSGGLLGQEISFEIDNGNNNDNGTASITHTNGQPGNTLTINAGGTSGTLTVRGDNATKPGGNGGNIKIVGKVNGEEVGTSPGFSVCHHPIAVKEGPGFKLTVGVGLKVEVAVDVEYEPDGVGNGNTGLFVEPLSYCYALEQVKGPIFGGALERDGEVFGAVDEKFFTIPQLDVDTHGVDLLDLIEFPIYDANGGGEGSITFNQVRIFYCDCCGMSEETAVVIPKSGYEIKHVFKDGEEEDQIIHTFTKKAKNQTVNGFSSDAGPSETVATEPAIVRE